MRHDNLYFYLVVFQVLHIFYQGIVFGLLPWQQGISTEGHIFGTIAGVVFSWLTKKWSITHR
ncbi:rhomboid family intramembrane serine protease [Xenorhabdus miraniensis]|uniref:rhomboid family intramembrane serine protease n=1 Tax=Xenorhabdus miraniensis TaxID=351674 RepID=UPI000C03FDD9